LPSRVILINVAGNMGIINRDGGTGKKKTGGAESINHST
jgi:hypothetical protein